MDERYLHNALRWLSGKESEIDRPNQEYLDALETIGLTNREWGGSTLTTLGRSILRYLEEKLNRVW